MKELDSARDAYLTSVDCLAIVSELLMKSRKGATFHGTIFASQLQESAKRLIADARAEIEDLAIVSLVSVFEKVLFSHPKSPLRGKAARQGTTGLSSSLVHFKSQVESRVYEDAERLWQYRNWVAHGKRYDKPAGADPVSAHACLEEFLVQAGLARKD